MRPAPLLLCALLAVGARAQTPETPGAAGAEAAVGSYAAAFSSQDYRAASGFLDPAELKTFAGLMVQFQKGGRMPGFNAESLDTPADVFVRFLEFATGAEALGDALASARSRVLGSVAEGDSLRHVVVRTQFELDGVALDAVETTMVRWTGARWVVAFDDKMRQFQQTMRAALGQDGQP